MFADGASILSERRPNIKKVGLNVPTFRNRERWGNRGLFGWGEKGGPARQGTQTPSLAPRAPPSRLKPDSERMKVVVFLRERKQGAGQWITKLTLA